MTSNEPTVGCLSAEVLTRSGVINIAQLYVILSLDNVVICVHPNPHRRASCERSKFVTIRRKRVNNSAAGHTVQETSGIQTPIDGLTLTNNVMAVAAVVAGTKQYEISERSHVAGDVIVIRHRVVRRFSDWEDVDYINTSL